MFRGPMKKAARRQQILDHARDVFARRGYHAATVDDIVAAAGVARGTFYLYFQDKRDIFEEIVDRMLLRIGSCIERVDPHDPTRSVADQMRGNIQRVVTLLLEDHATTKIFLSDAMGVDPDFDKKLESFYESIATLLRRSLEDGQTLGIVVEGDARLYAYLTLGALKELLFQVVLRGWEQPVDQLVDRMFAFLRGGYLRVDSVQSVAPKANA